MKITISSIQVSDQEKALKFYTETLNFVKKHDQPIGDARWLTVVSPDDPDGPELLLEPNGQYPAMKALKESLVNDGIPYTMFKVDNVEKEYDKLINSGVTFTQEPTIIQDNPMGPVGVAIFDDTCGNLIMMYADVK